MKTLKEIVVESQPIRDVLNFREIICKRCKQHFMTSVLKVSGREFFEEICIQCRDKEEREKGICKRCGGYTYLATFPSKDSKDKIISYYNVCPYCEPKGKEGEYMAIITEHREANFRRICPANYLDFNPSLIPYPKIWDELTRHNFRDKNKPSLYLYGASGTGKTRIAYQLIKRCVLQGYSAEIYSSVELSNLVSSLYLNDVMAASKLQKKLSTTDILFIDDFGKGNLSQRNLSFLFDVVDRRISEGLPMIFTTNDDKNSLLSKEGGANFIIPILRRLEEFSVVKVFK